MIKRNTVTALLFAVFAAIAASSTALCAFDAALLNNQGVEFYDRGNYAAAIDKFESAIAIDPVNQDLHLNLGYACQAAGNHKKASEAFKNALLIEPTNLDAHNSLGVSLYHAGEIERAVAEWTFVLTMDAGHVAAAANLGMARNPDRADAILKETKEALASTVSASSDERSLAKAFEQGKSLFSRGDFRESEKMMAGIIAVKPTSKFSYYYLGMSQAYVQKNEEAMGNLREYLILESYPPESSLAYERAMATFKDLRAGKTINPKAAQLQMRAADAFSKGKTAYNAGDFFRAIHFLNEAYSLRPDSYDTNYYLGLAYREVADRQRAVFHLTKCMLAGPEYRSRDEAAKIAEIVKKLTQ
ncbi:MAG TPA: tetratricopeptide repeat protein [bacterium]|mgnify:FL=1|nr:tetratricopeptide repeat protein [bacterium]